jgi:hypothetical protein
MSAVAWKIGALGGVLVALAACAVGVGGAGYDGGYADVGVGYEGGFYEPYGYDYGGWGGRYHVGPPRGPRGGGGEGHPGGAGGRPTGHPGGGGRPAPSIPGRPRGH